MAYQSTFYIYDVPVTCTGSGSHDWITADFMIQAVPNSSNTAYNFNVYARIDSSGRMSWTGDGDIRVTYAGNTTSKQVQLAMYSSGTTKWDGPATFSLGSPGVLNITISLDLDLTRTTGTNGSPGPTHNSDGGNLQHFYYNNYNILVGDGGLPPLLVAPQISSMVNTNKHNNIDGVSASTNSISISWTESGTVTNRYYRLNSGSWVSASSSSITISNLSPGTSYNIDVYSSNSAGSSNVLSISIRTRHSVPVVSLTLDSRKLDSLVFKWTSDKPLISSQYKVDNGSWNSSGYGTSGTITIDHLIPNTKYNVYFKGVSTIVYDNINSNEASTNGTTIDIARITNIGDCIFGNSISITVSKPATNVSKLKIWTTGNSNKPEFEFNVSNGVNVFTPTQNQLDLIYRCFTTSNSVPIYFSLTTIGEFDNWYDTQQNKTLQLTGIAKTANIGVNNIPRRSQVFLGINNTPKRAIVWIGDENNKPRRCI